jgi:hypothetical protein
MSGTGFDLRVVERLQEEVGLLSLDLNEPGTRERRDPVWISFTATFTATNFKITAFY